jgi:hypothetical protein
MKLMEILLGASLLVGASGCPCPDGHSSEEAEVARSMFAPQINDCLASDAACEKLCRAVFSLSPDALVEKCVIRSIEQDTAVVETTFYQQVQCVGGRRPGGFVEPQCRSNAAGAWLAQIATVEAASITAFARLVRALERFGAPAALIAEARAAILDEVVHAHLTAQLARAMGATVDVPQIVTAHEPTLAELARENAVEGQVAELFGALLATCQAQLATDPMIRSVFARIAIDETRHAQLAQDLAVWFDTVIDDATRAEIAVARRAAVVAIVAGFDPRLEEADRVRLGIPDAAALRVAAARVLTT